jgi:hypothetical protein
LERKRQFEIWWNEETLKVTAAKKLQMIQIQAIHDVKMRMLKAISSLQHYNQERLLEIAKLELERIVANAEQEANRINNGQQLLTRTNGNQLPVRNVPKNVITCPFCRKKILYPRKKAGKTVACPHMGCGQIIRLPPLV